MGTHRLRLRGASGRFWREALEGPTRFRRQSCLAENLNGLRLRPHSWLTASGTGPCLVLSRKIRNVSLLAPKATKKALRRGKCETRPGLLK